MILANGIPVYGAFAGKIVFFQVLWIYWVESLILIGFDLVRIAAAKGRATEPGAEGSLFQSLQVVAVSGEWTAWTRLKSMIGIVVIRGFILLFYLIFLVLFVGFQVTDDSQIMNVGRSIALRDPFVNTALLVFVINGLVQLIGGFFLNGLYRTVSPQRYSGVFDARTVIMHVMIGTSIFIHLYLFQDKPYAWAGEAVYVAIFMVVRTVIEIRRLRSDDRQAGTAVVMI